MTTPAEPRPARERVYQALKQGAATRPELAARTGLSVVSVIAATDELVQAGLATLEDTPPPGGRGRPAARVRLLLESNTVTALDLGGDRVTTARYTLLGERQDLSIHTEQRAPALHFTRDAAHNISLLETWLRSQGPASLSVVSVLGAVHPRKSTLSSYPLNLTDHPLEQDLTQRLGWPVRVENDANLSAWHCWHTLGLSREEPLVFLNYSAGIGLGMVLGGQVHHGATGAAGEVSQAADPDHRGRHQMLARRLLNHLQGVLPMGSTSEVAFLAAQGNPAARKALRRFNQDLANHLTAVAAVLDPEVMVLQDLPHAATPLLKEVERAFSELHLSARVMVSPLGPLGGLDSAGACGIRCLERQKLGLTATQPLVSTPG